MNRNQFDKTERPTGFSPAPARTPRPESTAPGVLILHPSTPAIAPLNQSQLTS